MPLMPGAIRKELTVQKGRKPMATYNRVGLHIAVSESKSLFGYFNQAGHPDSHFYVRRGTPEQLAAHQPATIEQYVDTALRANADYEANDATISVETQGGLNNADVEHWDESQILALASIVAWAIATHGIKPQLASDSVAFSDTSKGVSWHRLGIDPWRKPNGMHYSTSRGKRCPGDARIAQIPQILELAVGTPVAPVSNPITPPPPPTPPAPPAPKPAPPAVLRRGSTGARVVQVQRKLKTNYPAYAKRLVLDGIFGPATEAAVREFQRRAGLVVDGIVGPKTLHALGLA